MAVSAAAYLKRRGHSVKLIMRGGKEAHGTEVISHAQHQGLVLRHAHSPADAKGLTALLKESKSVDVINLTTFVGDSVVATLYSATDAVLANSGHEPFGLVGLEVMAAGGLAVTGSTGEDYAEPYRNAVVLETDDPVEIATELTALKLRPRLVASLRKRGHTTARDYVWDKVIDQLSLRVEFAAARQAVKLNVTRPVRRVAARRGSKRG
jgi:glycosyltransferase involved in cell wall biosynthesis